MAAGPALRAQACTASAYVQLAGISALQGACLVVSSPRRLEVADASQLELFLYIFKLFFMNLFK